MDSTHLAEVETCFLNTRLSKCVIFLNVVKNFAKTPITIRFSIEELVSALKWINQRLVGDTDAASDCPAERMTKTRVLVNCAQSISPSGTVGSGIHHGSERVVGGRGASFRAGLPGVNTAERWVHREASPARGRNPVRISVMVSDR